MDADLEKHQTLQLPGTCDWLFNNLQFQDWLAASGSSCLSVRGVPGSGKSVASSSVVRRLERDVPSDTPVLYFFCKKNDEYRDTPSAIIRTLALQLVCHSVHGPGLSDILNLERSLGVAAKDLSRRQLWCMLSKMLDRIPVVYLVLDALDECSEHDELNDVLEEIVKFSHSTSHTVKVLVTYRPNEFELSWTSIDIEERDVQADINAYATYRIDKSATLSRPAHRQKICDAIQERAGGTFLWAKLMLDILQDSSPRQIQQVLADVPRGLSNTYRLMLERVCDRDPRSVDRCRKVLHWCVAARRLLTVDELLLALAVSEGVSSHEEYDAETDQSDSQRVLRLECGSLIHVLKDNTVQLLHTSLREYLLLQDTSPAGERLMSTSSMQIADLHLIHRDLAITCLLYNQFSCFGAHIDMMDLKQYNNRFPLSGYALSTWIHHVCNSGDWHVALSSALGAFLHSNQGWRWLHRCVAFDITRGHLQVFQRDLKVWIDQSCTNQSCTNQTDQGTYTHLGNFILHLSELSCKNLCDQGGWELAHAESGLGLYYQDSGRIDEALKCYERELAGFEKGLGNKHPSTLAVVNCIAGIYFKRGHFEEALQWSERALAGFEEALGNEHPLALMMVGNIGSIYYNAGQVEVAREWFERALAGFEKTLDKENPSTLDVVIHVADFFRREGHFEDALQWYERALAGREKVLGMEHPSTLDLMHSIALLHGKQGHYPEALQWLERALVGFEKTLGKEHPSTLNVVCIFGHFDCLLGHWADALQWYQRALAGREMVLGTEHPETLHTMNYIALLHSRQGHDPEALQWYERALAGYEKVLGKEHSSTLRTAKCITDVRARLQSTNP